MSTIPEEMITSFINSMLDSEPGAVLHHMIVVAAPAFGPLGLPVEEKLKTSMYAIAPVGGGVMALVRESIAKAFTDHHERGETILFAALSQETWTVDPPGTVEKAAAARRLHREGRLSEHPDAQEVTFVYAVCRDGRRWRAKRAVTGPGAGEPCDVELLVGRPDKREAFGMPWGRPLRALVGQAI